MSGIMTVPEQLPNESARAYAALKSYCADPKRSIRRCARRLGKSATIIARWSKRYDWQKRLRELELEDCKRAVTADEKAKLDVAEERERERLNFQQRALEVSRRAIEKGLEILKQPLKGSRPSDAARLFAVAYQIGADTLGLTGAGPHFGLRPVAPPNIRVVLHRDAQSDKVKANEDAFFAAHPELRRPKNGLEDTNGL